MNRQLNLKIDIDSRKVTKYNDLIKVGDTVTLSITLTSKGNTVSLSGETVKLFLKKEDNKKVEQSVNVSGNTITCTLSAQATTKVGQVVGELTFTGSNTKLTSSSFIFNVEGSVSNEVLEQSKDDVEILTKITDSITKANNTVETYRNNINAVAGTTDAVAALTEMKGLSSKAEANNTNLTAANTQATKNIKALTELGDATNLAKDVEALKKQTLESNYTSIETDSVLTKLESVKDGFVDNMVIGGKTVQSVKRRQMSKNTWTGEWDIFEDNSNLIKTSTEYTLIVNVTQLNSNVQIHFNSNLPTRRGKFENKNIVISSTGAYKFLLTSSSSFSDSTILCTLRNAIRVFNTNGQGTPIKFEYMLLEGDWTDKQVPPYFEGIKSVGESEDNQISVKTRSKNLYSYSTSDTGKIGSNMVYNRESRNKIIYTASSDISIPTGIYKVFTVPYGKYNLSFDVQAVGGDVTIKDMGLENIYTIKNATISPNKGVVHYSVTGDSKKYGVTVVLYINKMSTGTKFIISNIQLEQSQSETTFEPYKEDTIKIQLKEPLRGLPNGVKDTIDFEKGVITRNVGKIVLNGTENTIGKRNDGDGSTTISFNLVSNVADVSKANGIMGNLFIADIISSTNGVEGLGIGANGEIFVEILRSKLGTKDVNGFKKWLQSNNLTIYYPLKTPTTEKLEIKDTLQTFKDGYIQLENSITPVVNLDFSTNYPSIVANLKEKLDALMDRMATVEAYITEKASASIIENI